MKMMIIMIIKKYLAAIQNLISEQNWIKNEACDFGNDSEISSNAP